MLLEQRSLKKLKPGEKVTDYFVVRKAEVRRKRTDGTPYLLLDLGNANGRISAVLWEDAEAEAVRYPPGTRVKIQGRVAAYREGIALYIEKIRPVREEDGLEESDLIPGPRWPLEEMRARFDRLLALVADPNLSALLAAVFSPDFRPRFECAPAGKLWHHSRTGGLLEHTVGVAEICEFLASRHPELQRDVLLTGALLHDAGKVAAYQMEQGFIDFSDEGRLLGHVALGAALVQKAVGGLAQFPSELATQVLHLILSHHGEMEKGASVVPMTLEAFVLYLADELDAKIDAYLRIAERERTPERRWSRYVRLLDRYLFFPPGLNLDNENGS